MSKPSGYRIETKHLRKFKSLMKSLNKLMDEVRMYEPEATWYLQEYISGYRNKLEAMEISNIKDHQRILETIISGDQDEG